MCLNCGCGEYEKRHKPSDITTEDLAKAAEGQSMDMQETVANMQEAMKAMGQGAGKSA